MIFVNKQNAIIKKGVTKELDFLFAVPLKNINHIKIEHFATANGYLKEKTLVTIHRISGKRIYFSASNNELFDKARVENDAACIRTKNSRPEQMWVNCKNVITTDGGMVPGFDTIGTTVNSKYKNKSAIAKKIKTLCAPLRFIFGHNFIIFKNCGASKQTTYTPLRVKPIIAMKIDRIKKQLG